MVATNGYLLDFVGSKCTNSMKVRQNMDPKKLLKEAQHGLILVSARELRIEIGSAAKLNRGIQLIYCPRLTRMSFLH